MRRLLTCALAFSLAALVGFVAILAAQEKAGDVIPSGVAGRASAPFRVTDSGALADVKPEPKTLTDLEKLQIVTAAQELEKARKDLEIAQLKVQLASDALQKVVAAKTPAGYSITAQLTLEPLPAPVKEK